MRHQRILILGSTGSIGINTLKVIERFPERFKVVGLTAYTNFELIEKQIKQFSPQFVAVSEKGIHYLKRNINKPNLKLFNVETDLNDLVKRKDVDCVVIAMRGSAALNPFLSAISARKKIAPANKEAIVIAGEIIMREAKRLGATIVPIDSEQSAIFQCLDGRNMRELRKIFLTASGGPLLNIPRSRHKNLSVKEILNHPRWKMGKKITVDSATMMNKGFEVIEAKHLFGVKVENIEVVIHPEAIIHSMVEFIDGSIMAQLAVTDMRLPIQYALTYPDRFNSGLEQLDFFKLKQLNFQKPDFNQFPSLSLAIYAGEKGGTLPCVLNAADEEVVEAFLNNRISFAEIHRIVEKIVMKHRVMDNPSLNNILEVDRWAREEARKVLSD